MIFPIIGYISMVVRGGGLLWVFVYPGSIFWLGISVFSKRLFITRARQSRIEVNFLNQRTFMPPWTDVFLFDTFFCVVRSEPRCIYESGHSLSLCQFFQYFLSFRLFCCFLPLIPVVGIFSCILHQLVGWVFFVFFSFYKMSSFVFITWLWFHIF